MTHTLDDAPSTIGELKVKQRKGDFSDLLINYLTIQLEDIIVNSSIPFDVFFPFLERSDNTFHMQKILNKGDFFSVQLLETFQQKGIKKIHIADADLSLFLNYLSRSLKILISSAATPLDKKIGLIYQNARYIIQRALDDPRMGENIDRGAELVEMMADFFAAEHVTASSIYSLFSRDYTTFTHSVQVCLLGIAFYNFLGYSKKEGTDMGLGALFHDLGKNFIDPSILNKPAKLTAREFAIVKKHPVLGYRQVLEWHKNINPDGLQVILHHHEAMDGSGYPSGLKSSEIHPHARIAHIIDVYDALTTTRSYKEAVTPFEALRIMMIEMRHSLDNRFLKHFIRFLAL